MSAPTTAATNLTATYINSNNIQITFDKGDGLRRLISVTEGGNSSDIRYPIDGVGYDGSLKFGNGDPLVSLVSGTGSCYPYYPYPDPEEPVGASSSTTYVVYEGLADGTTGIDIINLKPQTTYQIIVLEHTYYCYIPSSILKITTGFAPNTERFNIKVFDNRTKLPIENADIAIKNSRGMISDFGLTDQYGKYDGLNLEEGRYELSVVAQNYDSKILTGLFIQREEPRRDNYYRMFTSAGNTEYGGSVERNRLKNKNDYTIYLDPLNTTARSYTKYQSSPNPSNLTKL